MALVLPQPAVDLSDLAEALRLHRDRVDFCETRIEDLSRTVG
eukprot:CAMPEP_0176327524 /NCGR_PEP_ID=MMETSP0121_2-20121125/74491_1 /TAXON_ID=160619 /ORGANISM="Kryptoperidinium foliaceum, Strain CCMP 1326" /LENGTH=41 /DNA_ID= /DNA_START= /DNA_END= /DNA_ORIENTATION=